MGDIDGREVDLAQYNGQVLLIVNVASQCGFTPQYEGLEALYRKYKDRGFVVLAFPANNFMGQEPGTNEEIKLFCTTRYDVSFPVFSKISVRGKDMAPLYRDLVSKEFSGPLGGSIKWNFTKFLVGRDGSVRARFGSRTKPSDQRVVAAIESALEESQA
jgi:glutathione peroxidase